jgi:hypothetical protein
MVHPSQRENTNERVKHRRRPPIAFETALVPIFGADRDIYVNYAYYRNLITSQTLI